MGYIFILLGLAVVIEAHGTAPKIYVGVALAIGGLLSNAIEERGS